LACDLAGAISGYRGLLAQQAECGYGAQVVRMLALEYMNKRPVSGIARKETLSAQQSASVVKQNVDFDDVR
jgi:hypothetical protein